MLLARNLRLDITDKTADVDTAQALGCNSVQGFMFAPLTATAAQALIAENREW